jgi:hypothetical protein
MGMHWKKPDRSLQFMYTDEGYVVTKTWSGQEWIYMAWRPATPIPGTQAYLPQLLNSSCQSAEIAMRLCDDDQALARGGLT